MVTGAQGLVKGVVGGAFENLGVMQGSLYSVLKLTAGGKETRRGRAGNAISGIALALKGLGLELYHGTTGLFLQPYYGASRGGITGFAIGVGKGVAGLTVTPFTGLLRAGQSVSEGISGSANWLGDVGKGKLELLDGTRVRARPKREIDVRGQIKIYNEDLTIVHTLMRRAKKAFLSDQRIRFYALLPVLDENGSIVQESKTLLLLTNELILLFRVFNFLDMQDHSIFQKSLLMSERLTNISDYRLFCRPARHIRDKTDPSIYIPEPEVFFLEMKFEKSVRNKKSKTNGPISNMDSTRIGV
jgi:hypothetical protein